MIIMTLDEFFGHYVVGGDGPNGGWALFRTRQLREPGVTLAEHHGYTIATCSEPGAVVTTTGGGSIIGALTRDSLWIDAPYRGQGLSVEMYVQRWLLVGRDQWIADRPKKMVVTPAGYAARVAGYRALVARGHISAGQ